MDTAQQHAEDRQKWQRKSVRKPRENATSQKDSVVSPKENTSHGRDWREEAADSNTRQPSTGSASLNNA